MIPVHSDGVSTILVVEDEPTVRNVIVSCLLRAGFRVLEADSAAEALSLSAQFESHIEMLIADHSLKSMTGREVALQIRQSRPGIKVLQMSGYLVEQLEKEGELLPDAEFLGKPFLPKVLIETVKRMLVPARGP
jgi:CheY-like chemotaxis protein